MFKIIALLIVAMLTYGEIKNYTTPCWHGQQMRREQRIAKLDHTYGMIQESLHALEASPEYAYSAYVQVINAATRNRNERDRVRDEYVMCLD